MMDKYNKSRNDLVVAFVVFKGERETNITLNLTRGRVSVMCNYYFDLLRKEGGIWQLLRV